jgi:hypothetical protein
MLASFSKYVRVVSLSQMGVCQVPSFSTAAARCVTALSILGTDTWPEVPERSSGGVGIVHVGHRSFAWINMTAVSANLYP